MLEREGAVENMGRKSSFVALVAEDSEHDILAIRRAWKRQKLAHPLYFVRDGEQCLDYLHQRGDYAAAGAAPPPDVLLLDLNMPRMGGFEVLKHIREHPKLRRLPVIVLTTSKADTDRKQSYELGANAYMTKPSEFDELCTLLQSVSRFLDKGELPP